MHGVNNNPEGVAEWQLHTRHIVALSPLRGCWFHITVKQGLRFAPPPACGRPSPSGFTSQPVAIQNKPEYQGDGEIDTFFNFPVPAIYNRSNDSKLALTWSKFLFCIKRFFYFCSWKSFIHNNNNHFIRLVSFCNGQQNIRRMALYLLWFDGCQ